MSNISFFIPAYNCAETIIESVGSIMETNFTDGDELVIVNDCSIDVTSRVLKNLNEKHPEIKIIQHIRNKGGAAARNTAIENTKNELLFCLDSDNILEKNSIKPLKDFLLSQNAEIACFNELRYFSKSTEIIDEVWTFKPNIFTIQDLLSGKLSPGASGNYLFTKRSWIKANGYTEDLGALDTWAFGFKQLIENCRMVILPKSWYFHRRGHQSYYLRDAWNKRRSVSLRLIKLIINYVDLLNPDDVNYIFSKKGRYTWFDNLEKRPIRLKGQAKVDPVWVEHEIKMDTYSAIHDKVRYYKNRLIKIMK